MALTVVKGLSSAERVSYLANVLSVCDGSKAPSDPELAALKEVADRLGATREDARAARELAASGHFKHALMRDARTRRDNLEDMVLVALADDTLQERESVPIERLAGTLGYTQADVDIVLARAQGRLNRMRGRTWSAKAAAVPPPLPAMRGGHAEAPVSPAPVETPQPVGVVEVKAPAVSETRGAVAQEAGDESAQPDAGEVSRDAPYDDVQACARRRDASDDPTAYCFGAPGALNVWGCRLAHCPWTAGQDWLAVGWFRESGCFVPDREALQDILSVNLALAAQCPYLDMEYVRHAVAALPSRFWPGLRWTYRRARPGEEGTALSVREYRHGCAIATEQRVTGMDPVGDAGGRRVIRDACRAAHRTPPDLPKPREGI